MSPAGRPEPNLSERVLGLLLASYPRRFRARFGEGMQYALRRDYQRAHERGIWAVSGFWMSGGLSLLLRGFLERVREVRWIFMERVPAVAETRSSWQGAGMGSIIRELRFALRRLIRQPWFTLAAVGTLALGIGATTAIFSVVDGVILRPLPYANPDQVVFVGHRSPTNRMGVPDAGYFHYKDRSFTLQDFAVYLESSATITGTGEPLELGIIQATPSLLQVLDVSPMMGRGFVDEDVAPGAASVAVVSYGYWVRQLGRDLAAVGKPVLEGASTTVVGVLPPDFEFVRPEATFVFGNRFDEPDLFFPLSRLDRSIARFGNFMYQGIGRLAPGVGVEDAQRELEGLMYQAAAAFPSTETRGGYTPEGLREAGHRPVVMTVKDAVVGDVARVLWILMGAVLVVLLIATANVANLFMVRAESRRGEIAIQRALGAGRASLARSFLSESALLSVLGGLLGVALAWVGTRSLLRFAPADLPRLDQVGMDSDVLLFAVVVSLFAGLAFGIVPSLRTAGMEVAAELTNQHRGGGAGRGRRRAQDAIMVGQVALALVLLVGSGLLLRTFQHFRSVDPGFDPSGVLTVELSLGENIVRGAGYDEGPDDAVRSRFMIDIVRRLAEVPGVEAAAFTGDLPLDGSERRDYIAVEQAFPEDLASATIALRVFVGPGYLQALGAQLRLGRELEEREFAGQPRSVVVNRAFAEQRWPGENPVGRRITQYWPGLDPQGDVWFTVVGVVDDVLEASLMERSEPTVYLPTIFLPEGGFGMPISNMIVVLRTSGNPLALAPSVRQAIHEIHPELPINEVATLEQRTARSFQNVSFAMVLLIIAGAASALLGMVGIYGTVAYVVSRRTREFGLRIALGASAWDVGSSILRQASVVGAAGIGFGVLGAIAASRVLESLLFGVEATDPLVYGAVASGLFLLVLVASLVPAVRAASVDPVEAMRVD